MQGTIIIRRSVEGDRRAISRLAELDSRPSPRGEALLAIVDGELQAVLPLGGGEAVANPFKPTEDLAALLRVRAYQERLAGAPVERPAGGLRGPLSSPRRLLSWRAGVARV